MAFGLSVLFRVVWVLVFDPGIVSDARWYFEKGMDIAGGGGYVRDSLPTAFYPVGYPAFLGILFSVFGTHVMVGRLANIVLYVCSMFVFHKLIRLVSASEFTSNLAVFMMAVYPNHLAYTNLLYNETLYLLVFLSGLFSLVKLQIENRNSYILFSGFIFGLARYVKPQALLIPAVFYLVRMLRTQANAKQLKQLFGIYVVILAITLPWQIRNYKAFGSWEFITSVKGYDLLIGNNPTAKGNYHFDTSYWSGIPWNKNESVYDEYTRKKALSYIETHPGETLRRIPVKIFYFFWPGMEGISWNMYGINEKQYSFLHSWRFLMNGAYLLFLMIFLASVLFRIFLHRRKIPSFEWAIYILMLYHIFLSVVFFGESRFHFHLIPLMIFLISSFFETVVFKPMVK